jgi:hypothetical protein
MSNIDDDSNSSIGIEILARKNVEIVQITLNPSTPKSYHFKGAINCNVYAHRMKHALQKGWVIPLL